MIKTGVYKNTDAQIYNWPPLGVWFEVCEEECQLEELWAPLGPLKVVSAITFLLFPSLPCASVSVFICGQSLITKSSGSCVAGELPPVSAPWDLAGNTSTYLQSYFAIIGCPVCHHLKCIELALERTLHCSRLCVEQNLNIQEGHGWHFLLWEPSPVKWKDGLMVMNVITLISSQCSGSKTALVNPPTLLSILQFP